MCGIQHLSGTHTVYFGPMQAYKKFLAILFSLTNNNLTNNKRNKRLQKFNGGYQALTEVNRPFSGAPSGENLLLRWTSYQTSLSEKHSFYGTLVGKLQQKD